MNLKKIVVMVLILTTMLSMTACGGPESSDSVSESDENQNVSVITEEEQEDIYDINDFIGSYRNGLCRIYVSADKDGAMQVRISQARDTGTDSWGMSGTFDTSTGILEYKDASYNLGGNNIIYLEGTGHFEFSRENNVSSMVWKDDMEDAGKDNVYIRSEEKPSSEIALSDTDSFTTGTYIFKQFAGVTGFNMTISDDLSFSGEYTSEGAPLFVFEGKFDEPQKVEEHKYKVTMQEFKVIDSIQNPTCFASNYEVGYEMEFILPGYPTENMNDTYSQRLWWYFQDDIPDTMEAHCIGDIGNNFFFHLKSEEDKIWKQSHVN